MEPWTTIIAFASLLLSVGLVIDRYILSKEKMKIVNPVAAQISRTIWIFFKLENQSTSNISIYDLYLNFHDKKYPVLLGSNLFSKSETQTIRSTPVDSVIEKQSMRPFLVEFLIDDPTEIKHLNGAELFFVTSHGDDIQTTPIKLISVEDLAIGRAQEL